MCPVHKVDQCQMTAYDLIRNTMQHEDKTNSGFEALEWKWVEWWHEALELHFLFCIKHSWSINYFLFCLWSERKPAFQEQ